MTDKPFRASLVEAIFPSIATLFITVLIQHFTLGRGLLIVDDQILTASGTYIPVKLVNHSSSTLYGLRLLVPSNIKLDDIYASFPVKISLSDDNVGFGEEKEIVVNGIKPEATTILTIFSSKGGGYVTPVNARDVGLSPTDKLELQSPLKSSLEYAAPSAVMYFLAFLIFNFAGNRRLRLQSELKVKLEHQITEFENQVAELEQEIAKARVELEAIRSESRRENISIKARSFRLRFYLEAQLSATRRELEFWRNTVRKVLYQTGSSKEGVAEILRAVSQSLGTQLTHKEVRDYEHLEIAMDLLLERQGYSAAKGQHEEGPE